MLTPAPCEKSYPTGPGGADQTKHRRHPASGGLPAKPLDKVGNLPGFHCRVDVISLLDEEHVVDKNAHVEPQSSYHVRLQRFCDDDGQRAVADRHPKRCASRAHDMTSCGEAHRAHVT